jgi:putative membrane protein
VSAPSEEGGAAVTQRRPGEESDTDWHRVHPLTPALRSWQMFVVLIVFVAQDVGQNLLSGQGVPPDLPPDLPSVRVRVLAGGGLVALLLLGIGVLLAFLSWRFTRYRVTADALELREGVVSRRQRRAPLDRLQAVDVVQPLLARIVGLARLTLEVAGGGDSRIELAYLTEQQARQLRNHLLACAAGLRYAEAEAPEAPVHLVFTVPLQRLVGSLVLSGPAITLAAGMVGFTAAVVVLSEPGAFAGVVPTVLAVGGVIWRRFTTGFGFEVATAPDGLRLRHGLLEHRTQTVPPGRVQAVRLRQPLLWRLAGWWAVDVNVAGYGNAPGGQAERRGSTLLPVGTRDEAVTVLSFVLPDLGVAGEYPGLVVDAGLAGTTGAGGFTGAPRRARWVDPLGWRREGFRVTSTALLLRRGVLHRQLDVVPHARTQSCGVVQGPVERRLGLASFALHSTPGPVDPVVEHLGSDVAAALLAAQLVRARQARATAGPERWMERPSGGGHLDQPAEPAE